ncbi:MAG: hypothetical protein VZR09_06095 [Candidatus Gastranaerophilaceae bacterium]|nr:hypothetical protein [Candidatus Gastranaerophilaceae bacterium]
MNYEVITGYGMLDDKFYSDKKEHLRIIEDIIARMAGNSFQLKGWAISLISAILVFANLKNETRFIWIAILPIIVFWVLDAFYLQLERKYRELYKKIQQDYINNTNEVPLFDMNINNIKVCRLFCIMFSRSVVPIYLVILIATIWIYFSILV